MIQNKREYKPYTRLWIYGFNVDVESITNNLNEIKKAGIGGVELQVIYPVQQENNIDFFSPDFFKYLNIIIDKAHELDLDVDLTLGSGWPFGAGFITKEMSPDILLCYQQDIIGPTNYSFDFTNILSGKIVSATLVKVENGILLKDSLIDVTSHVEKTYISVWPWGEKITDVKVDEGVYRLFIYVSNEYRQRVGKAGPNMDGYVMDHCREDVTNYYLEQFGDTILDNIDHTKIRSVFCDSIELTASNWTKYLFDEFKLLHNYDLRKYMPALWTSVEGIEPYIRCDYFKTYSNLTIDNFFLKIKEWSNQRGIKFRLQAHGTWADILDAYQASDISEGETFGEKDYLETNINHRRLAVSAGMLNQSDIVSNETYTWLRKPRFLVSLEMMKRATDACFLDGINHIINHGYSYYKNETFENIFYASSVISPHNTWWQYYPKLSKYIENTQKYLQNSKIKSRVAILTPTSHIWATNVLSELHMSLKVEQHLGVEFANELTNNGYWFSFVNDRFIQNNEDFILDDNQLEILLVPDIKYINLDTLTKIKELSNKIPILFLNQIPSCCDTYIDYENKNEQIKQITNTLSNSNNVYLIKKEDTIKYLDDIIGPDIVISNNKDIGYIIKENKDKEKYIFISNVSNTFKEIDITYDNINYFKVYDLMNDIYLSNYKVEANKLSINLEPNQSIMLIETKEVQKASYKQYQVLKEIDITSWTLNIENEQYHSVYPQLWNKITKHQYYSGKAVYEAKIKIEEITNFKLKLEKVNEICEVWINDVLIDTLWHAPYQIDVSNYLKLGDNTIKLVVTNLLFNAALNYERKDDQPKLTEHYPYLRSIIDHNIHDKVDTFREKEENIPLQDSGIENRVILESYIEL